MAGLKKAVLLHILPVAWSFLIVSSGLELPHHHGALLRFHLSVWQIHLVACHDDGDLTRNLPKVGHPLCHILLAFTVADLQFSGTENVLFGPSLFSLFRPFRTRPFFWNFNNLQHKPELLGSDIEENNGTLCTSKLETCDENAKANRENEATRG